MIPYPVNLGPPVGAEVNADGVHYRVWAPNQTGISVIVEGRGARRELVLRSEGSGYWAEYDREGRAGDLYCYRLPSGQLRPDVASRFQPEGVHGRSECIDPLDYQWQCENWKRPAWTGQSIYELHIGTLTPKGTFAAAITALSHFCDLGVQAIEIMPVADFSGNRNWGYDGVALYAPAHAYGRPDDLRALVDAAHAHNLTVILDVVYNHLGPSGNYLADFNPNYFRSDRTTPWGRPFNLDGNDGRPVRDLLVGNAAYWLDEFRFDGLRLDATHAIPDESSPHLLAEIAAAVQLRGGFVIAEDDRNDARLLRHPENETGHFDAVWADDFHHQVRVSLTGIQDSYFRAYRGTVPDLVDTLRHGWTYRGQPFPAWSDRARGTACNHLPTDAFIVCLENHDQIGNRARGERLEHLVTPAQFRAATMLLCLSPYTPLIFMGQEWASTSPFLYFTNHEGELGQQVTAGRRKEFASFGSADDAPDPESVTTFLASKLNWAEQFTTRHRGIFELYRACLRERNFHLTTKARQRAHWRAMAIGDFIIIRYEWAEGTHLLVVVLRPASLTESPAILTPPFGCRWHVVLQSESPQFGGSGHQPPLFTGSMEGPRAVWLVSMAEDRSNGTH